MSAASLEKLLCAVAPFVTLPDKLQSQRRTGVQPISIQCMLQMTLRWVAGGSYIDIRIVAGVSVSFFYSTVHKIITAITKALSMHFPVAPNELVSASRDFASISTRGLITGCVAAVDGYIFLLIPVYLFSGC